MLDAGRHLRGRARPDEAAAVRGVRRQHRVRPARWRSATSTPRSPRPTASSRATHRGAPPPAGADGVPRARSPSWDAADRAAHHPHRRPSRRTCTGMLLPPQLGVADGADPGARGRRRRRLRAEERRVPRGRRRRGRVHRPRPPGEVDRGPRSSTWPPAGRPARRWPTSRRRSPPTACSSASGWTSRSTSGAYPCDPFPGAMIRRRRSAARSRARPRSRRIAAHVTPRCSATRRRTSRTAGRGPPATSCASACSTSSPRELGHRPARRPPPQLRAPRRAAARDAHRPAVRRRHHPGVVEQAATHRRLGRLPAPPGAGARPRAATSGSASRRTSRRRPGPRCRARAGRRHPRRRGHAHLGRATTAIVRSSPAAARTARATRRRSPRSRPTSSACRSRTSRCVFGDTDITPFALVGTGGSRAATMANGVGAPRRRGSCASKILSLAADAARGQRRRPRDRRRRHQRAGHARASTLSLAELARIVAEEPDRLPDGRRPRADGDAHATTAARAAGRAAPTAASSRSTSRPASSRSSATSWSRTAACRSTRPSSRARSAAAWPRAIGAVLLEHAGLRRGRPVPRRHVHGLPAADDDRGAQLRDPPRRDRR